MKHYYFKYLIDNKGIKKWEDIGSPKEIDLSIYYGSKKDWKTVDYPENIGEQHANNKRQIDTFFNLKNTKDEIYFWVFYTGKILCFRSINLNVYDGPEIHNIIFENKLEYPKSIKAELVYEFNKIDLPEFFSNINSNQKYNRTTIKMIENSELEFANSLIDKRPIRIDIKNILKYLSPMQFETLLFQIFTTENSFCSSFRGGTLKDYDLKIIINKMLHGIPVGKHWIQVKLKGATENHDDLYLAHIGKSDIEKKILGSDWILNRVLERNDILNWLKNCVFDHELLDFEINSSIQNRMLNAEREYESKASKNKYIGCLIGGAIGDALGAPIEFLSNDQIQSKYGKTGVRDYVEHGNGFGEFTDDTQMTLFTAEGLLRAWHRSVLKGIGGAQTAITFQSYLRWLHTQGERVNKVNVNNGGYDIEHGWLLKRNELFVRRAPGNTCISALQSGIAGSIELPINDSKGCGTVMRIAPVGLVYKHDREIAFREAVYISALTHGHPSGYLSGGFLASVIADLANRFTLDAAINNAKQILKSWESHSEVLRVIDLALVIHENFKNKDLTNKEIEKIGSGWTAEEALAISLLCALHNQDDFEKGVLLAVNHSGDSDSTGAITGNILGLMLGSESIPNKWKEKLLYHDIVEEIGLDLFIGCKSYTNAIDHEWLEKYPEF